MEKCYLLYIGFQSRLLQICRMWERVKNTPGVIYPDPGASVVIISLNILSADEGSHYCRL